VSIYLAKKTSDPKDSPTSFQAKGLGAYSPSPIGILGILGKAKFPEAAYSFYRTLIDAFCYATSKKERVYAHADAFDDVYVAKMSIPFQSPPLAFSPATKLKPDEATAFLAKLPNGASMKNVGKTLEYVVPNPYSGDLPKFLAASNPIYTSGPDRVTPLGFKAYLKVISVLELFLGTNTYPAFKSLTSEVPQGPKMTYGMVGHNGESGKDYYYSYNDKKELTDPLIVNQHTALKRRRLATGSSDAGTGMDVDAEEIGMSDKNAVFVIADPWISSSVVTAKPSAGLPSINFGPPGAVPALPGMKLLD
jgi:hypothetical protein